MVSLTSDGTKVILRPELGDYSSIIFLKAIITGLEDALGEKTTEIALNASGRRQGKDFAKDMNLANKGEILSLEEIKKNINRILGQEGTRLCIINKIVLEEDSYKVYAQETFCSAGESLGSSRKCTYTLGIIQGLLEAMLGKRLIGQQTESVLRGGTHDVLKYSLLD